MPFWLNGLSLESVQKQISSTKLVFGGLHFPCTSNKGLHSAAQAGRVENGTMTPFGVCLLFSGCRRCGKYLAGMESTILQEFYHDRNCLLECNLGIGTACLNAAKCDNAWPHLVVAVEKARL